MAFSPNIQKLQPSATIAVSTLAKKLRSEGRDIVDLSAGEPDFDTPGFIASAGMRGIADGGTRYTPTAGMPELRKAIAGTMADASGRAVDWNAVVVSCGAKQALFNACFTLFGPGDEVIVATPYWTSYPEIVNLARAEPVFARGDEGWDFRLTPADLDAAASDRTRGLILCSPCNPTGTVYSAAELEAIARWAGERGVWLISDEIYRRIYYGDEGTAAPGLLDLPVDALDRFVLVDGVSKAFAMTGWRIGWSYTPDPELAPRMSALQSHVTSNPAAPSQLAAFKAFTDPEQAEAAVAEMVRAFRRRRDLVESLMDELLPDMPYVDPLGAFYLFFRVDGVFDDEVPDSGAFCTRVLRDAGVALVPGTAFGDDRYVRMSYAASDEVLEKGIRRMAGVFSKV